MNTERWQWYDTQQALTQAAGHTMCNIKRLDWTGRGWYHIRTFSQRCPRNCCDDWVYQATSAEKRVAEIAEEMRELAGALREAREKKGK